MARPGLRASGQVVLFPGYLAVYEEGRDDETDDEGGAAAPGPRWRRGQGAGAPAPISTSPNPLRAIPKPVW